MIKAILFVASISLTLGQMMDEFVDNDFFTKDALRAQFESEDFVIKYDPPQAVSPGGTLTVRGVDTTPFLGAVRGNAISTGVYVLQPCGVVNPHSHPGGGENIFVTAGTMNVGMVGAGRILSADLVAGESFQVEQGLVHWLVNDDCDVPATAFIALPTGDGGFIPAAPALFSIPDAALFAALPTLSIEQVEAARAAALGASVPAVNPACVARCAAGRTGGYGGDGESAVPESE